MKKFLTHDITQRIIESFLLGLGMGLTIDFLIVHVLTLESIWLHVLTIILIVVMIIFQFQYLKTIECEKNQKEKIAEWERKHEELYQRVLKCIES